MSRSSKSLLLEEEIHLLVRHFGVQRVRGVLAKISIEGNHEQHDPTRKAVRRDQRPSRITVANGLELIRENSPEKHRLLSEFLSRLNDRKILPESQDIRHFAQLVGLKDVGGKSRKDMIPKLMRFLLEQPVERLKIDLEKAGSISNQQRLKGFSILTDKLLGNS
jgi:hypothetical protein